MVLDCPLGSDGCDLINWNVRIRRQVLLVVSRQKLDELRFQIGSYINDTVTLGLPEAGSSFILAPLEVFNATVKQVEAVADETGKYVVDCTIAASLPPLQFHLAKADFSGLQLLVEAKDYVRNVSRLT